MKYFSKKQHSESVVKEDISTNNLGTRFNNNTLNIQRCENINATNSMAVLPEYIKSLNELLVGKEVIIQIKDKEDTKRSKNRKFTNFIIKIIMFYLIILNCKCF